MKILILTNNVDGIYLFRKELVQSYVKKGAEVVIALPKDGDFSKLEALGARVVEVSMERRGMNPVKDGKLLMEYFKIIKKERPKVVLTYTIKPNIYGGMAASLMGVPYLVNITGLGTAIQNGGLLADNLLKLYALSCKSAKCVFFQNKDNMSFMKKHKIGLGKSRLLPGSGVNLQEHPYTPYPSEENGIRILSVFRIMKDKGIEEYLELIENINETAYGSRLRFELIGEYEPETKEKYEPRIRSLVERGMLKYYGYSREVFRIMGRSHIILHPSYHEGLSNVLLEAASCGRPVLASYIPGCKETFRQGITGMGFLPQDERDIERALKEMLVKTEEERRHMGQMGRALMEKTFDRKFVLQAYEEEIRNIR